jgi:hypothetical protein
VERYVVPCLMTLLLGLWVIAAAVLALRTRDGGDNGADDGPEENRP